MDWDQDIGIPMAGRRDDGEWVRSGEGLKYREIGELLLRVDEMEDTLQIMGTGQDSRPPNTRQSDARRVLEERIRSERVKIEELERRGGIRYDEVERAIRLSDAMG